MSLSTVKPLDQTRWHNPANLDLSLVGPNHKLLSTEDLNKPLPEGAEFWSVSVQTWFPKNVDKAAEDLTYRIPLKPVDRLRQERDRLDELIKIVEAVEKGATLQMLHKEKGWLDAHLQDLEHFKHVPIRLKPLPPAPSSIPWTLETHPDVVCVKRKRFSDSHHSISQWRKDCAHIDGYGSITYEELHRDWLQRNGDPAGQEVQG